MFISIPFIILVWMLGGQLNKLIRPILVPIIFILVYLLQYHKLDIVILPVLFYGFSLTIGYGENSKLYKWLDSEQEVRIVYGILLGIPVIACAILNMNWLALLGFPLVVAVSCIRLGSWGKIWKYDILPVDIFRGLSVGLGISLALI